MLEFKPFPKMPRLSREVIITEKLDGTNASVIIEGGYNNSPPGNLHTRTAYDGFVMFAFSRNRQIYTFDDNYGFAGWVQRNAEELLKLGPGQHFGEWWGNGIQRNYGLKEKRFSLFNASRWLPDSIQGGVFELLVDKETQASTSRRGPACVSAVPILYRGDFSIGEADYCLKRLEINGSIAAPGFGNPEGIVIYHTAAKMCFKKTYDDAPKSLI